MMLFPQRRTYPAGAVMLAVLLGIAAATAPAWAQSEEHDAPPAAEPAAMPSTAPAPPQLPFEIPKAESGTADPAMQTPTAGGVAPGPGAGPMSPPPGTQLTVAEDIRDIRGSIHIPAASRWAWIAALVALGILLIVGIWYWFRRREAVRIQSAYEIAFEALENARSLMRPERARDFSFVVSEIVRIYIDRRFAVGVRHRTTEEFVRALVEDASSPLQGHTERLADFLGHCDLAKFARWALSMEQMEAMHASAWQFVEETKPQDESNEKAQDKSVPSEVTERGDSEVVSPLPAVATGVAS